ncbi:response regulator [Bacillus sp. FJAT-49711]|uniref:hybrid sensor histidine kinase/response regulator n=1 Tax=Bacillus sp. FJAT-49711 TaxID=2833585 RepID=UPI001BC8DC1E|nr:ATP-binding protein [Bacillus sp. FJAT-49711]MBS4220693.1 response regulator [Bacillus sp. FJAT-49711]
MDLRNWDIANNKPIALDGEWEFYPDLFLSPNDIVQSSKRETSNLITVPGTSHKNLGPTNGRGTYRLKILVNEDVDQLYGIRFPVIKTASKIFVNGKLVSQNGRPTEDLTLKQAQFIPFSKTFSINNGNNIEILISSQNQVSDFKGGIHKSILFGSNFAIKKLYNMSIALQYMVCIIMILHGLYACIFYLLRRKNKEILYFAIAVFLMAFATSMDDDKLLLQWIPISYEWSIRLLLLFYSFLSLLLLLITKSLISEKKSKIMTALIIFNYFRISYCLLIPFVYVKLTQPIYLLTGVLNYAVIVYYFIKFLKKDKKDSVFLLLAAISVASSAIWGSIKSESTQIFTFYPIDLVFTFLALSIFWFKGFFRISDENEKIVIHLQEEDKKKDEFLTKTSHELRTPLHVIVNMAQAISDSEGNKLSSKNKYNLELLTTTGQRLSLLLNDLIDVSRLKERVIRLNKKDVDLHIATSIVIDMMKYMIGNRDIRIVNKIPTSFPTVKADENRLSQILVNLLHNALKNTNEGNIIVRADIKNDMVLIHIEDTGIGMDEATKEAIFEPYIQGESGVEGGIGLGLSISKQLVELHGGFIHVESIRNKGSIFTFSLPIVINDVTINDQEQTNFAVFMDEVAVADEYSVNNHNDKEIYHNNKILVVDDDPINLHILSSILSEHYHVTAVTSGSQALSLLHKDEWSLIITDIMMPNMSGYELTRSIRTQFSISELPILFLTAKSQPRDIYAGFESGANDYVTKPIIKQELVARVKALLNLTDSISERLYMEAAWLQAQIQPHFLYNTINSITSLSELDTKRMSALLEEFGHYLRKSFDPINLERLIPIEQELELVKSYLYIEKERFKERINVIWDVDNAINIQIPPLSIQTLVENSVRHGLLSRMEGGTIFIGIKTHGEVAIINIKDNGIGMSEEKLEQILFSDRSGTGVGLRNTNKRLVQIFGKGLEIISTPNYGTNITIKVPIIH